MKLKVTALVLACIFGNIRFTAPAYAGSMPWFGSWGQARNSATAQDKPMLVVFYTEWCPWCKKMDSGTFRNPAVVELARNFVPARFDAEGTGEMLARSYRVDGFPTILFTDANGKEFHRVSGYEDEPQFAARLRAILAAIAKGRQSGTSVVAPQKPDPAVTAANRESAAPARPAVRESLNLPSLPYGAMPHSDSARARYIQKELDNAGKGGNGAVLLEDSGVDSDSALLIVDVPAAPRKVKRAPRKATPKPPASRAKSR